MRVFEYFISIIMIFVMCIAGVIVYFTFHINESGLIEINNKIFVSVSSDDMVSAILKGDLIVVDEVELNEFQINNVVAYFSSDTENNTNVRVARIIDGKVNADEEYQFLVKADNNSQKEYVDGNKLIGRWTSTRIPFCGFILMFLLSKKGYSLGIVLPLAMYFIYQLIMFIISCIAKKNMKKDKV